MAASPIGIGPAAACDEGDVAREERRGAHREQPLGRGDRFAVGLARDAERGLLPCRAARRSSRTSAPSTMIERRSRSRTSKPAPRPVASCEPTRAPANSVVGRSRAPTSSPANRTSIAVVGGEGRHEDGAALAREIGAVAGRRATPSSGRRATRSSGPFSAWRVGGDALARDERIREAEAQVADGRVVERHRRP